MSNWKNQAAASIKTFAPVFDVRPESDDALASQLQDMLEAGTIAARDMDFAQSLLSGFKRWESFTDRQRPHVLRLIGQAPAKVADPLSLADADTAAALRAGLQAGTISARDAGFAQSLLAGFDRYGSFSERQRPYARRIAEDAPAVAGAAFAPTPATPVPAPVVAPQTAYTALTGLVNLDTFARFTVGSLSLSLKNDGTVVWVKWDGVLAGSLDTLGRYRPSRKYLTDEAQRACTAELDRVNADPMGAAQAEGIATGRCSCCGRALTDPVSIGFGIGPICRSKFG